jgi:DNA-binding transcriptional LysR family regulator
MRVDSLRRLPPLNALKAFEAAARPESFTRAAEELFVTQGAVSHQVKALEEELGVKLFNRERQRLVITEAGREYLTTLRDAFDRIALGTERLLQRQSSGALTVSTSPDFAAKWLVNRLGRFAEEHPSIDLRVSATLHHVDFAREDVDLAVRHGDGNWPGLDMARLSAEQVTTAVPFRSRGTSLNANTFIARLASSAVRNAGTSLTGLSPSLANPARTLGGISLSGSIALEMAVWDSPRSLAMRLKCAAAIWLLADPCKQTNRTVCLSDAPGNPTTSPPVAGVERARWKNLRMEPISRSEILPQNR